MSVTTKDLLSMGEILLVLKKLKCYIFPLILVHLCCKLGQEMFRFYFL